MNVSIPSEVLESILALAESETETRIDCLKDAGYDRDELETEISDCQDTLSVVRKAMELHQSETDVRHPYYEMSDRFGNLMDAVSIEPVMKEDKILRGILRGLGAGIDVLLIHLNMCYRWDNP